MSSERVSDLKVYGDGTGRLRAWLCCLLAAAVVLGGSALRAQTAQTPAATAVPKVKKLSPRHARKGAQVEAAPEPVPEPAKPEAPHWPVNENPGQPSVTWDAQGLKIAATNSSLKQILNDVSNATGAKVEGLGADQRVFGDFGPGQAKDVLSQLLVGSGYNVLMIGDQGEGTPRQIVLSTRHAGKTAGAESPPQQPEQDIQQDDDSVEQPEPEVPFPAPQINNRPPNLQAPGGPPEGGRTPQQVLQELQQRQQQMQDQQQIAPQQDPPGPPPQD
jgi:hypothetical protein